AVRVSIQQTVALVGRDSDREAVTALAQRRFGWSRPVIGSATELVDHYGKLAERGVERVYTWFCDFAPPDTLTEFGEDVIAQLPTSVSP
ncbi:MAG: LLM class flavin-dependent oxidoreductase, partial [Acidimicrobiia bacterium]